jgi:ResB-like family
MDDTAVQTSPSKAPPPPLETVTPTQEPSLLVRKQNPIIRIFRALGSMRITVTLLAMGLVLVYAGTAAQMNQGIWTVVHSYFRSFYVLIPFSTLIRPFAIMFESPEKVTLPGVLPFPGGFTIGAAMLLNMIFAYCFRYPNWTWKRSGVLLLHAGLIVMLSSEVISRYGASEGHMTIDEGASSSSVSDYRSAELAVTLPCEDDPKFENRVTVPASLLKKNKVVRDNALPFEIELVEFMVNSTKMRNANPDEQNPATAGIGRDSDLIVKEAPEVNGTAGSEIDYPSAYVTFKTKDQQTLGTYLLSTQLRYPQTITVDGKQYSVALQFKRTYLPYSLHLIEFKFDKHPGTKVASNYSSLVRLDDPAGGGREITIKMNDPLRHRGETFYQADFDHDTEKTTDLQVVHNPGRWLPYISCVMVATGMLFHFGIALNRFLERRRTA